MAISSSLAQQWHRRAHAVWLVVDEGPGLTGSSLAAAADRIVRAGVDRSRVVLMPHWTPNVDSFEPHIASIWRQHRIAAAPADGAFDPLRRFHTWGFSKAVDLSGGRWRELISRSGVKPPAVNPLHERRKWLLTDGDAQWVVKFAGLGSHGARVVRRARLAAEAGFGPDVMQAHDGLLACRRAPGAPLDAAAAAGPALVTRLADYLGWIGSHPASTVERVDADQLLTMATVNTREALGPMAADRLASRLEATRAMWAEGPTRRLDARMFPHEWIASGRTVIKTDGAEHDDDHFFPGPQHLAWDVAGTIVEWRLRPAACRWLVARVARTTRDRILARRVPIYSVLYLSFRAGYTAMSARMLGASDDGRRMQRSYRRYVRQLGRALEHG